jgi:hypothetical protein
MSKSQHGNKEAKKPKQDPALSAAKAAQPAAALMPAAAPAPARQKKR